MPPANRSPPLEDMSGALKSTRISLSETISGREKSFLSLLFGFFDVSLHMRSVFKTLIFSNIKVLIFVETTKEKRFFFYASMNYSGKKAGTVGNYSFSARKSHLK
jgi:hypothetical protein